MCFVSIKSFEIKFGYLIVRSFTILLLIIFLLLYFGYPKYEEYKFVEEIRENMRTEQPETPAITGLPITADVTNDYPNTSIVFYLTDLKYSDLTPALRIKLREEVKKIACRNLEIIRNGGQEYKKAMIKIFEEDHNSMKITVRDRNKEYIADHHQTLSECRNFEDLKWSAFNQ